MAATRKRVLLVGWHPSVVDYSKWPGLTAEKLEHLLVTDKKALNDAGVDASIAFVFDGSTAVDEVSQVLQKNTYDVVLIGAGVRKDDDHFLIFEKLVNTVHKHAPGARIAFNTGPTDTADAVNRWI